MCFAMKLNLANNCFFDCVAASKLWKEIGLILGLRIQIVTLSDITILWNDKKKNALLNMIFAAILRTIWITRNDHVFNRSQWFEMQGMWRQVSFICAQ
jgi:hypothetical protein